MMIRNLGLLLIVIVASSHNSFGQKRRVEQAESKCLDHRRSIISGTITLDTHDIVNIEQPTYTRIKRRFELAFDGNACKQSVKWTLVNGSQKLRQKMLNDDKLYEDNPEFPVIVQDHDSISLKEAKLFDPRVIGIAEGTIDVWYVTELNSILGRADRGNLKLVNLSDSMVATNFDLFGANYEFHMNKKKAYQVEKIVLKREGINGALVDTTKIDLKRFGKHWFPKKVDFVRMENGAETLHQVTEVKSAKFNTTFSDSEFMLSGFNLPKGRQLLINNHESVWDGKGPTDSPFDIEADSKWVDWKWVVGGFSVITIGIGLLFVLRRKSS